MLIIFKLHYVKRKYKNKNLTLLQKRSTIFLQDMICLTAVFVTDFIRAHTILNHRTRDRLFYLLSASFQKRIHFSK